MQPYLWVLLEIRTDQQIDKKKAINAKNDFIGKWWTYLDDCFFIWDTTIDSLEHLLSIL